MPNSIRCSEQSLASTPSKNLFAVRYTTAHRGRAIGEGLVSGNADEGSTLTCDPRICHPRRAPDLLDEFSRLRESAGSLPSPP